MASRRRGSSVARRTGAPQPSAGHGNDPWPLDAWLPRSTQAPQKRWPQRWPVGAFVMSVRFVRFDARVVGSTPHISQRSSSAESSLSMLLL